MKLINFKRLSEKLGDRSRSSVHRDMRDRGFPLPISFGGSVAWDEEAVDLWLDNLAATPYEPKNVAPGIKKGRPRKEKGV